VHPHEPFQLRCAGEPIGRLRCDGAGMRAEGELEGRRSTFECTSLTGPRITIRTAEVAGEFAAGTVEFSNGARYEWRRPHLLGAAWCFRRHGDKSSICVEQASESLQGGGKVTLCCDGGPEPETPVLVLLAWYLRILSFERLVGRADLRLPVF